MVFGGTGTAESGSDCAITLKKETLPKSIYDSCLMLQYDQ